MRKEGGIWGLVVLLVSAKKAAMLKPPRHDAGGKSCAWALSAKVAS